MTPSHAPASPRRKVKRLNFKLGPLKVIHGPPLPVRLAQWRWTRGAWWAVYWNDRCVSLAPTWYGFHFMWRD